jgi:phage baseplate assembly protein W
MPSLNFMRRPGSGGSSNSGLLGLASSVVSDNITGGGTVGLAEHQVQSTNTNASKGFKQTTEFFYNPDDLNPDTAIGVLYPLNKAVGGQSLTGNPTNPINGGSVYSTTADGAGVFRLSYTTEDQAISNLKMLLLTRMGERLYHPTFGTRVQALVFEPNTDELADAVEDELKNAINFWLPYIIINDIFVNNTDSYGDIQHRIEIKLRFRVTEQGANQEIILIVTGDSVNAIQ